MYVQYLQKLIILIIIVNLTSIIMIPDVTSLIVGWIAYSMDTSIKSTSEETEIKSMIITMIPKLILVLVDCLQHGHACME